jgi:hypothetical protein
MAAAHRKLVEFNVISHLCKVSSMASQTDVGSNDALRALLLLCTHDEVGDQCLFDFIRTDAEEDEESVSVVDDISSNEGGKNKETTSATTTIRMGGRGIARMLEIALSSPPPPSPSLTTTATTETSIVSANAWIEWYERVNYACALLANATRIERGAVEFIGYASTTPSTTTTDDNDDVKPQATLLLARFLNPSFVNVNSKEYKKAIRVWKGKNSCAGGDNNDDDDEEDGGDGKRRMQTLPNKEDPTIDSDNDDDYSLDDNYDDDDSAPSLLTNRTKNSSNTIDVECYDPYQHVAAVIMNIAQLERGRDFLMKLIHTTTSSSKGVGENSSSTTMTTRLPGEGTVGKTSMSTSHLQSLLTQLTSSPNPIRRQGIAGMIKNCCFSSDSIWWLLHVVHIDKTLLLPLAGPEELSIDEKVGLDPDYWLLGPKKVRETDALVRLYIVEALLLLLASGRQARDTLRERRTYVIIKLADMVEEDETVSDRLLECVQYLRRDEYGTEEGSSDKLAYEGYTQKMFEANNSMKSSSSSSSSIDNTEGLQGDDGRAVDYDNID